MSQSADGKATSRATLVLDTSILYAFAQPWLEDDLRALHPLDYVVPAIVLFELDRLIERTETRGRARAALNVLKGFVDRGASQQAVSCGDVATLRVGRAVEVEFADGLDPSLADDRVLACARAVSSHSARTLVATAEFAQYAKALSLGLEAVLLERAISAREEVPLRERIRFKEVWRRVESADSLGTLATRLQIWWAIPLVQREVEAIERGGPELAAARIREFRALWDAWRGNVGIGVALGQALGISVNIPTVDFSVRHVQEPTRPLWRPVVEGAYGPNPYQGRSRPESAEERANRLEAERQGSTRAEQMVIEQVIWRAEILHDAIVERVGDFLI